MKNNDIINNLMDDNIIDDIQADINAELEKSEPDYDKIAELTALITEIKGDSLSDEKITENISRITEEYDSQNKRSRIRILYRWISALSACLVLVIALNAYTMVSFGENLFRTVVEMTQSGFSIDFSGNTPVTTVPTTAETIPVTKSTTTTKTANTTVATSDIFIPPTMMTQPATTGAAIVNTTVATYSPSTTGVSILTTVKIPATTEDSPLTTVNMPATTSDVQTTTVEEPGGAEGNNNLGNIISEKCSEIGITTCSIDYFTDMELKDFSYEENEVSTDCYFTFMDNERQLDIIIEQYNNAEDIPTTLIPSNQKNYYAIPNDNIGEIFLFDEDTHITAVFVYENTVYTTIGHNFAFSDIEEIMQAYYHERQN